MKSINAIVHLILFLAVAVLYILHFTGKGGNQSADGPDQNDSLRVKLADVSSAQGPVILYINTDSLWENYTFVKEMEEDLESEKARLENSLKQKMIQLDKDYQDLQQKYQSGLLSDQQAAAREQELIERRNKLLETEQEYTERFLKQTNEKNKVLQDAILGYLRKQHLDKNVSYVFGYQPGGVILYGRDSLDITSEVINGLNLEYNKTLEEEKTKK